MEKKNTIIFDSFDCIFQDLIFEPEDLIYFSDILVCDEITEDFINESD